MPKERIVELLGERNLLVPDQRDELDQVGQALDSAHPALSSLRNYVSELATVQAGHLTDLQGIAWNPPPTRAHRC